VIVPWSEKSKRQALRFWSNELCFNARLHRDYAEACAPFAACRGVAQRLASLTEGGDATGARLGLSEGVIVLPREMGAMGSATINGNPRGINYATRGGAIKRPTLAIIDDPQDRKTANSRARIEETIERIDGDVAGMAGPDARMSLVLTCTVIERDDVAEHYLTAPDWRAVRVGQVVTWPEGWGERGSKVRALWDDWNAARLEGEGDHDGGAAAVAFYRGHKAELTAALTVSWAERYDRKRGQPDALYSAMYDFYSMGEAAFMAERQNMPLKIDRSEYELSAKLICSRVTDRAICEIPNGVLATVAATDLNPSYALKSAVVGFGAQQTSSVLWYDAYKGPGGHGIASGEDTSRERAQAVYEALVLVGKRLAGLPCKPELWLIDASGTDFDTVLAFAGQSVRLCGLVAVGCTGRAAKKYRPYGKAVVGHPREQCHLTSDTRTNPPRKWLAFHSDYWREAAQRAWLGSPGAPGSCSLFSGRHVDFAEEICREQLHGKGMIGGELLWNWHTQPGPHDYGDVMTMAYVAAAWQGIGTQGRIVRPAQKKRRRTGVTVIEL
jgi:hypothetical protein